MDEYTFDDALTGSAVRCEFPGLETVVVRGAQDTPSCTSLFFPGCSFINFGLPLVETVHQKLVDAGRVEGISLLCCGKILSFEPDGDAVRASFEVQLRESMIAAGVERIVAACPNCVVALRAALAVDVRTSAIEVVALPGELAEIGCSIDAVKASDLVSRVSGCGVRDARVCVHDSCPDRETGEFADGLRALLPAELLVQTSHERERSFCCGSLLRAAGKPFVADAMAVRHGEEAQGVDAAGIITSCMSCAYQLSVSQRAVPVFHYLELLCETRICWEEADTFMKLRFLFDDVLGATQEGTSRSFAALAVSKGDDGAKADVGVDNAAGLTQGEQTGVSLPKEGAL